MNRLNEAAQLIRRAAKLLDDEAWAHPITWRRFEDRLSDAGADRLEEIANEIELVEQVQQIARAVQ